MGYDPDTLPFNSRPLDGAIHLAVSQTGDHAFLTGQELHLLRTTPTALPLDLRARLQSRFFIGTKGGGAGLRRLAKSRIAAKRETVSAGPSLHIIVPTLQCAHSCRYCQVSRSLSDQGHTMSDADIDAACDTIFDSSAQQLTIEFQGGDPLIRFDLVERAILRITELNRSHRRAITFVVASTLHQLDEHMCSFFLAHRVFLSTSVDGPPPLHNRNRPTPGRDSYERTIAGIDVARSRLGQDSVSALMTTTRESLEHPEAIVDEYVKLGFRDVFLRPLSWYGFAKRNQAHLGYSMDAFAAFYRRGLDRVLYWNRLGVELREVYTTILLNKILSSFDGGYVDLQSPSGAGRCVLVYNYDGFVYPSDEARMLAETGDRSLRLGRIGQSLRAFQESELQCAIEGASEAATNPGCRTCPYNLFCAPNPIDSQAGFGTLTAPVHQTEHCRRHLGLFDEIFKRLHAADDWTLDLFHRWAHRSGADTCDA